MLQKLIAAVIIYLWAWILIKGLPQTLTVLLVSGFYIKIQQLHSWGFRFHFLQYCRPETSLSNFTFGVLHCMCKSCPHCLLHCIYPRPQVTNPSWIHLYIQNRGRRDEHRRIPWLQGKNAIVSFSKKSLWQKSVWRIRNQVEVFITRDSLENHRGEPNTQALL